jgi:hypothetical protein
MILVLGFLFFLCTLYKAFGHITRFWILLITYFQHSILHRIVFAKFNDRINKKAVTRFSCPQVILV